MDGFKYRSARPEQLLFMSNILLSPNQKIDIGDRKKDAEHPGAPPIQEFTQGNKKKNTLNITNGGTIAEYKEYLQTRCNKLCLFKEMPDIKPIYKTNINVKAYIDKNCNECTKTLNEFNRALDTAIERVLPDTDPSSPSANFNMLSILIENGTAIFNDLPIKFKKELIKFKPLDGGDIKTNDNSLLKELEINVKGFIERSEATRLRANLLRGARHGGRKSARRKRRKKAKTKRKTKRKKRKTKSKTKRRTKRRTKRKKI